MLDYRFRRKLYEKNTLNKTNLNMYFISLLFIFVNIRGVMMSESQEEYSDSFFEQSIYGPMKGVYLDSFEDQAGTVNCSIYFVYKTMFFIDECNASVPFVKSLNFTFSEEPVPRVVYTPTGILLEVTEIKWINNKDPLMLRITSQNILEPIKEISLAKFPVQNQDFNRPTLEGVENFDSIHLKSSDINIIMNSKTIIIFYVTFTNFYECNAFFWAGKGEKPDKDGIPIPNEYNSLRPIKDYKEKTITLRLPRMNVKNSESKEMTFYDIDYIGVYCPDIDHVYGSIDTTEPRTDQAYLPPPFIFDRFFLGEDTVLCLPNGSYSREIGFDDSMTDIPCLGGSSVLTAGGLLLQLTWLLHTLLHLNAKRNF